MTDINVEIDTLKQLPIANIQAKYKELFGETELPCSNRTYLLKRIAYKLQENQYGTMSPEAKDKIQEFLARLDPINNKALRPHVTSGNKILTSLPFLRDKRLPIPGSVLIKKYKGKIYQVKVLEKGFEYNNKFYRSLSGLVEEITNTHTNGFAFFNL
jgi:hypothetical protein